MQSVILFTPFNSIYGIPLFEIEQMIRHIMLRTFNSIYGIPSPL